MAILLFLLIQRYDLFLFEIEPDQGKLTSVVMKDNLVESQVHMPNVLTTHPTLMIDLDFIPFDNSLTEYEIFYFDIKERNSSSTTIHADISLPNLESFNFDFKPDPDNGTSQSKQILFFRQELLEYTGVHDNDASESSQPSWGKMCTSGIPEF
uniref:Uncharacterized protein n=1 Tax=Tanacetum cinerariifolium TaxID=118510 RepID=A0A6L2NQ17_TANCI|nr:hypothetical protein [Tanacetum cinerariifolium]